eukprot:CAMPEP_0172843992 /NCGR_PEP_ID=MMETSP1075-20121228/31879_1 /TAXON_ID=2916 /ORGANISM="Ceratium fusus, Strain PA161109" /LENGTH=59 /DNA_ID=CAMNT_0013688351 /DNA_START=1333 /DNA_END=1512 /DNA_ORIENTATION=+
MAVALRHLDAVLSPAAPRHATVAAAAAAAIALRRLFGPLPAVQLAVLGGLKRTTPSRAI